jgi:hypothetical protein
VPSSSILRTVKKLGIEDMYDIVNNPNSALFKALQAVIKRPHRNVRLLLLLL